jgi:hypothetical protein
VEEGLLLNGLGLGRNDLAVDEGVEPTAAVLADAADSDAARAEDAAMGTGQAAHASGSDRIVERFTKQSLADVGLGFVTRPEVTYPKTNRRLLPGEAGANGRGEWRVWIQGDRRRPSECIRGVGRERFVVHQALRVRSRRNSRTGPLAIALLHLQYAITTKLPEHLTDIVGANLPTRSNGSCMSEISEPPAEAASGLARKSPEYRAGPRQG